MRTSIILIVILLVSGAFVAAQDGEDCLVFTDELLKAGDDVAANVPAPGDETAGLLDKFLALQASRDFLITSLQETPPCHAEPALSLLDATLAYEDYITLRLGQKLVKDHPGVASELEATLDAANQSRDAYEAFWDPPDA